MLSCLKALLVNYVHDFMEKIKCLKNGKDKRSFVGNHHFSPFVILWSSRSSLYSSSLSLHDAFKIIFENKNKRIIANCWSEIQKSHMDTHVELFKAFYTTDKEISIGKPTKFLILSHSHNEIAV